MRIHINAYTKDKKYTYHLLVQPHLEQYEIEEAVERCVNAKKIDYYDYDWWIE